MNSVHDYITEQNGKRILSAKAGTIEARNDGYSNMVTKYGTQIDSSEHYSYQAAGYIPDMEITEQYIGNGLFAKIIDAPAEEAVKHGFTLGLNNPEIEDYVMEELERLDWEEVAATAIKWARLYGGTIIVMLVDDGLNLEDPLDWNEVEHIEELKVYERSIVIPDQTALYEQNPEEYRKYGSKFQKPELYTINSRYGHFRVHESRCLIMKNGKLPENSVYSNYEFFGVPEFLRLRDAMKETMVAHTTSVKMLERCVQAIYKMKNLQQQLSAEDGEDKVLKRLEIIDLARGILNSLVIDAEGEDYDFKSMPLSGVKDIIDSTCNMLSALTNIPQTVLFGRSPAGENSTGEGDMENYYNFVQKIQKMMLKKNLRVLLDMMFTCGLKDGSIKEIPKYKIQFTPLWSLSDKEQAEVDAIKATTEQTKATTAQVYVDMQVLDTTEVREGLKKSEEYTVSDLLSEEDDLDLAGLLGIGEEDETVTEKAANKQENEKSIHILTNDKQKAPVSHNESTQGNKDSVTQNNGEGVGVIVVKDGKVLVGDRTDGLGVCGPGGHIEPGETPEDAAIRETLEEFGITPKELILIGYIGEDLMPAHYCPAYFYLCTDYAETIAADEEEIKNPRFMGMDDLSKTNLFFPFRLSLKELVRALKGGVPDG